MNSKDRMMSISL